MKQNFEKMQAIFERQSERSLLGMAAGIEKNDIHLIALNGTQGFKSNLMLGLIEWRKNESPSSAFARSLDVLNRAKNLIHPEDENIVPEALLPLERAPFVSCLLGRNSEMLDIQKFPSGKRLDAILSMLLTQNDHDAYTAEFRKELLAQKSPLERETYTFYYKLLISAEDERGGIIGEIEKLFKKRQTDSYYKESEQTEGGGQDNLYVVDYRFGAILAKLKNDHYSIHHWRKEWCEIE